MSLAILTIQTERKLKGWIARCPVGKRESFSFHSADVAAMQLARGLAMERGQILTGLECFCPGTYQARMQHEVEVLE